MTNDLKPQRDKVQWERAQIRREAISTCIANDPLYIYEARIQLTPEEYLWLIDRIVELMAQQDQHERDRIKLQKRCGVYTGD